MFLKTRKSLRSPIKAPSCCFPKGRKEAGQWAFLFCRPQFKIPLTLPSTIKLAHKPNKQIKGMIWLIYLFFFFFKETSPKMKV